MLDTSTRSLHADSSPTSDEEVHTDSAYSEQENGTSGAAAHADTATTPNTPLSSLKAYIYHLTPYAKALLRWCAVSGTIGVFCGLLGSAFHIGVALATNFRLNHSWVIVTLPLVGPLIAIIYHLCSSEGLGTDSVIEQVQTGEGIRLRLLPAIFFSTLLTHLAGGSAGREGAALQMGGTVGLGAGRLFRLDERDMRMAIMAGMAAFFAALFGTPVGATIFAMAVISVGALYHVAYIPCILASLAAYGVSLMLGVEPTRLTVVAPQFELLMLVRVAILAGACGMLSDIFCEVLHLSEHAAQARIKNPLIRGALGGALLLALSLAVGTSDYNGAGMDVIVRAVEQGYAVPWAFLFKTVFTVITLSAGFKGGEVVPTFFIGATFGCVLGPLLGIPAGFAAALGLICVFCGATNCPIASMVLAVEMFGAEGLIYYALACGFAFMLSGYAGLYSSQRILYDKLKASYINVHANAYHEGGFHSEQ